MVACLIINSSTCRKPIKDMVINDEHEHFERGPWCLTGGLFTDAQLQVFGLQVQIVYASTFQLPDMFQGKTCPICIEPIQDCDGDIGLTKCGHAFHWPCLRSWQKHSVNWPCPVCRHCLVATCLLQRTRAGSPPVPEVWTRIGRWRESPEPSPQQSGSWLGRLSSWVSSSTPWRRS